MTKQELIELIEHRLHGGNVVADLSSKYDPRIISYHIGMIFNQIFYETFRKNASELDLYSQEYDGVKVLKSPETNEYYSELPNTLVQMPFSAGIRQIRGSGLLEESITFKPTTASQASVLSRGQLGEANNDIWYYVMGKNVYYVFMDENITSVKIVMLSPFQDLEDTAEIYIPSGKEETLFQAVINSFTNMPPQDKRNDNVSKQI